MLKDEMEKEEILDRDGLRIADIQSKMRESGRMQERVKFQEKTLTSTAEELIKREADSSVKKSRTR